MTEDKRLVTIKKAAQLTGSSKTFFWQLLNKRKLTKYRIQKSVYISMAELEALASQNVTTL